MLQIPRRVTQVNAATGAPTGAVGIDLTATMPETTARPHKWLATLDVQGGASNVTLWGCLASAVPGDATDDIWGLHNDKRGQIANGVLKTAAPVGRYHIVIEDIGIYSRLYFQNSANTVTVTLSAIYEKARTG